MQAIVEKQQSLTNHPVYQTLSSLHGIRHFMKYHVFAVWDFMSLLKALQIKLTCVTLPWKPSIYPAEMVRLINQIVLGEESDLDHQGEPISHFDLYLRAMKEVGADTAPIKKFLDSGSFDDIPEGAREFVQKNIELAMNGHIVDIAASFFYGREKLIPDMFSSIVEVLRKEDVEAPSFLYYLERHIEVDAGEHGPLALKALAHLTEGNPILEARARESGILALNLREALWDKVLESLPQNP
jgi:hypothetical protein